MLPGRRLSPSAGDARDPARCEDNARNLGEARNPVIRSARVLVQLPARLEVARIVDCFETRRLGRRDIAVKLVPDHEGAVGRPGEPNDSLIEGGPLRSEEHTSELQSPM